MTNQRENILSMATELFYEQGYNNTFFYQIADALNITKPLISYYFKSKSLLAKEVSDKFTIGNKNTIAFKLYNHYFNCIEKQYDLQLSTAIEIRLSEMLCFIDPKAARFVQESNKDNYEILFISHYKDLYKIHDRQYHLNINHKNDEISMLARGAIAATTAIRLGYLNDEFSCTMSECLDYITTVHFRFMRVDEKRIAELVKMSAEIIDAIGFEFNPYFKIE